NSFSRPRYCRRISFFSPASLRLYFFIGTATSMYYDEFTKEFSVLNFWRKPLLLHPLTGCGEIGRRPRLRIWRSNPCRFDPYHPDIRIPTKEQGMMNKELQNSIFLVPC